MPNLSDVADDVPIREEGKVPVGGASFYQMQALLQTAFAGVGGLPRDGTLISADSGRATDVTYAEARALLELYRCNLGVTPLAGQAAAFNAQGIMEAVEALDTDLSESLYEAGRLIRADGVAYKDVRAGLVQSSSGAPDSGLGYDGDFGVDHAAGSFYMKGVVTPGVWTLVASGGGGVSPQTVVCEAAATPTPVSTVEPVIWNSAAATFSGTPWGYAATTGDHYWTPPVAGLYEIDAGVTMIKDTLGGSDFRMFGFWDVSGGGSFVGWPSTPECGGRVGDSADTTASEGFCAVTDILQLTTSSRVRIAVLAQSADQSVKADNGYFKAKRIA